MYLTSYILDRDNTRRPPKAPSQQECQDRTRQSIKEPRNFPSWKIFRALWLVARSGVKQLPLPFIPLAVLTTAKNMRCSYHFLAEQT